MNAETGRLREEWRGTAGQDLPIDVEAVFPEENGFFERRHASARARLLASLRPVLLQVLEPGERIRYATRGFARRFTIGGALGQLANQMALVLTNRRLLLVDVNRSGRARDVKNQVRLSEVRGARAGLLNGFEIRLGDGKALRYTGVPRRSCRTLAAALPKLERGAARTKSAGPSVEHLCPSCLNLVPGRVGSITVCPNQTCGIPFREASRAEKFSLLVPGLGDLYLRHYPLGALQFVTSMVLLIVAVRLVLEVAAIGNEGGEAGVAVVGAAVAVGVPRVMSFLSTRYKARLGLVPLAERSPAQAARSLPAFPAWAYVLFLVGGAGLALSVIPAQKAARASGIAATARRAAMAGAFDEAVARWRQAESAGAGDEARARLAIALYTAGDLEDADRIGRPLAGRHLELELAKKFNSLVERRDEAMKDYEAGLVALAKGDDVQAWTRLDRALAFFSTVKRPDLPKTRGEAALHVAAALLVPGVTEAQLAAAERLQAQAGNDATAKRLLTLAALQSFRGEREHASKTLAGLDLASLSPSWRLLALETRLRLGSSEEHRRRIAEEAKAVLSDGLSDQQRQRLSTLRAQRIP